MMKRFLLCLAAVFCLLMGSALAEQFGVVSGTDVLNLRAQGSSSSQWLASYPRGTWVEIMGSQNNFYRVYTPDGRVGYMSKNYVDAVDEQQYHWSVVVTNQNGGAFLNFREQPSYTSRVLDIFYNGVPLYVHDLYNGWYTVEINGQVGYVRSEFVSDQGSRHAVGKTVATIRTPNNSAMNLRSGPGMNYEVIAQFAGDRYVSVLHKGKGWWYVSIDGYAGFMSSDYLTEGLAAARDLTADTPSTGATPYAVVNNPHSTQALNLRQYASTASMVLDKLHNGRRLWVNEQGKEWCSVTDQTTGVSGYVMTEFVKLHNLPSTPRRSVWHPNGTYVNLRSAPDMLNGSVRIRVPHGSSVTILIPGPDWCKVQYGGYTGYMMTYFLH